MLKPCSGGGEEGWRIAGGGRNFKRGKRRRNIRFAGSGPDHGKRMEPRYDESRERRGGKGGTELPSTFTIGRKGERGTRWSFMSARRALKECLEPRQEHLRRGTSEKEVKFQKTGRIFFKGRLRKKGW